MNYTYMLAHLEGRAGFRLGDKIKRGDILGKMGNTGKSYGAHIHNLVVHGVVNNPIHLIDIMSGKYSPSKPQLDLFMDDEYFNHQLYITTDYLCKEYKKVFGLDHYAYDIVPLDANQTKEHWFPTWNRWGEKVGTVQDVGYDESLGNYICISYKDQ